MLYGGCALSDASQHSIAVGDGLVARQGDGAVNRFGGRNDFVHELFSVAVRRRAPLAEHIGYETGAVAGLAFFWGGLDLVATSSALAIRGDHHANAFVASPI